MLSALLSFVASLSCSRWIFVCTIIVLSFLLRLAAYVFALLLCTISTNVLAALIGLILHDFRFSRASPAARNPLSCSALRNTNWTERTSQYFLWLFSLIQLNFIVHIQYEKIIVSVEVVSGRDGVSQRKYCWKKVISLSWVKAKQEKIVSLKIRILQVENRNLWIKVR